MDKTVCVDDVTGELHATRHVVVIDGVATEIDLTEEAWDLFLSKANEVLQYGRETKKKIPTRKTHHAPKPTVLPVHDPMKALAPTPAPQKGVKFTEPVLPKAKAALKPKPVSRNGSTGEPTRRPGISRFMKERMGLSGVGRPTEEANKKYDAAIANGSFAP